MKIRLLITGANGFTGCHLIGTLLKETSYDLAIIKRTNSDTSGIKDTLKKIRVYDIDSSYNQIYEIVKKEKPDLVVHLAATYPRSETKEDIELMLNSNII